MKEQADLKETPALLVSVFRQFAQLMQDEIALAKAELSGNLSRAGAGLALIGVGALLALTALDVLAGALVAYMAASTMSVGTAALLVGGGLLIVALALALMGRSRLRAKAIQPQRTTHNLSQDLKTMKEASRA